MIPSSRVNIHGVPNQHGDVVVYWMTSARRSQWNHALQYAVDLAKQHSLPLVVIECLALQHRWANDRISTFVLQGMVDNRSTFEQSGVTYIPYVETKRKEASFHIDTTQATEVYVETWWDEKAKQVKFKYFKRFGGL